jgi:ribosome recycling factor
MGMIEQLLKDLEVKMKKAVEALFRDLAAIRTARATPALVEHIKVDYHGIATPINQLASISVPEAKIIMIQPWDRTISRNIEKAILKSDIGLNPSGDGNIIRITIPPLTEERRIELIKVIHKRVEESRITLRNIRRDGIEQLRLAEKNKEISKDHYTRFSDQMQKLTDNYIQKANEVGLDKEREVLEV